VAVTNGNKKVTGTGTTFADTKNGVAKGHLFCITSGTSVDFYEVDYVVSNTELYLVQAYRGTTATGKAYEVITTFSDSIPEFARRLTATLSAYQQQSDAFQALLTSTATTIEVTAPDGTKQTLIPWKRVTSEGEGQTARAKTEADRAKTEADKSAASAVASGAAPRAAIPYMDFARYGINGKTPTLSLDFIKNEHRMYEGMGIGFSLKPLSQILTFTRQGSAEAHGPILLETAATDTPRMAYRKGVKLGVLLEPQTTNMLTYSEDLSNAVWGKTRVTVASVAGASPRGDAAYKVIPNGELANSHYFTRIPIPTASVNHTLSIYAKAAGYSGLGVYFKGTSGYAGTVDLLTGAIKAGATGGFAAEDVGDGWWRITITAMGAAGTGMDIQLRILPNGTYAWGDSYDSDGTSGIFAWGAQVEAAGNVSSYVATTSAQVTRIKDWMRKDAAGSLLSRSLTMLFTGGKQVGTLNYLCNMDDGANMDKLSLESSNDGTALKFMVIVGGVTVGMVQTPAIPANTRMKIAMSYDNATRRLAMAVNGTLYTAVASAPHSSALARFGLGSSGVTGNYSGGQPIEAFAIIPIALTDAELIEVTR